MQQLLQLHKHLLLFHMKYKMWQLKHRNNQQHILLSQHQLIKLLSKNLYYLHKVNNLHLKYNIQQHKHLKMIHKLMKNNLLHLKNMEYILHQIRNKKINKLKQHYMMSMFMLLMDKRYMLHLLMNNHYYKMLLMYKMYMQQHFLHKVNNNRLMKQQLNNIEKDIKQLMMIQQHIMKLLLHLINIKYMLQI